MHNIRPNFDSEILELAHYVSDYKIDSSLAYQTAYYVLLDSIACAFLALRNKECKKHLGPLVPNMSIKNGSRVLGTHYELDPVQATFNNGALIRWLDFNDTWLAAEWGHPSDNLAGIFSVADYVNRNGFSTLSVHDLLTHMIKAHEIQGVLALENSFNRVGLDHVVLVKIATTAVVTHLLRGTPEQICNAVSNAWIDGQSLRVYRHAPNTGPRKSWAAGDAGSRAVRLALMALQDELGYPSALTVKRWGFYDVYLDGKPLKFQRPYTSYVMENVLFKISFPAEFHAQTAVECALTLHPQIKQRLHNIEKIIVKTQKPAIDIITKYGPLHNPADRDHSLQYMIAIGLIYGELKAEHYEQVIANNPLIDQLRDKMEVIEEPKFTKNYYDPDKRAIGNALQIFFNDGTKTEEIAVEYPIGHRRRRDEGIPVLMQKFREAVHSHFETAQANNIIKICEDQERLLKMPVDRFMDALIIK